MATLLAQSLRAAREPLGREGGLEVGGVAVGRHVVVADGDAVRERARAVQAVHRA